MKRQVLDKEKELIEKLRGIAVELSENAKLLRTGRFAGYWRNLQAELNSSMRRTFRVNKKAIVSPIKKAQVVKPKPEPQPEEEAPRVVLADNSPSGEKETKRRISRKRRSKKDATDSNK